MHSILIFCFLYTAVGAWFSGDIYSELRYNTAAGHLEAFGKSVLAGAFWWIIIILSFTGARRPGRAY